MTYTHWRDFVIFGFVSNLPQSRRNLVTLANFLWLTPIEGIFSFLASSVTYICLGRILLVSQKKNFLHASHWLNNSFITLFQTWIHSSITSTDGIVSNAQYSMVAAVSSCPMSLSDSCLAWNNGWLCKVLPRLGRASPELDPWWQVWLCARRGLQCWVFWASPSCCNTWTSYTSTPPSCEMLHL